MDGFWKFSKGVFVLSCSAVILLKLGEEVHAKYLRHA